jgi:hypothetical protein
MKKVIGKPFEKGNSGRLPGVKNKRTVQWETFSKYCLEGGLKRFEEELNKLEGKEFVAAFTTLLEFHKPKLARTELSGGIDVHNTVTETTKFNLKKKG